MLLLEHKHTKVTFMKKILVCTQKSSVFKKHLITLSNRKVPLSVCEVYENEW